jgi:hypothetical protein
LHTERLSDIVARHAGYFLVPFQGLNKLKSILWGALGHYFEIIDERDVLVPAPLNFIQ